MIATPGDPGTACSYISSATGEADIAYGGSCTAGKKEDPTCTSAGLSRSPGARAARSSRREVFHSVRITESESTAKSEATLNTREVGLRSSSRVAVHASNAGPGVSPEGAVVISRSESNFPGRSGPGQICIWARLIRWLRPAMPVTSSSTDLSDCGLRFADLVLAGDSFCQRSLQSES